MTLFYALKLVHVSCALLSIGGFALRGYWALVDSPMRRRRAVRVLPHALDSLLLGTAVAMLFVWNVSPLQLPWVMAKIVALLLYIGLGMAVMRFARTCRGRLAAYVAALCAAGYIIAVALTHSAWGPLAVL